MRRAANVVGGQFASLRGRRFDAMAVAEFLGPELAEVSGAGFLWSWWSLEQAASGAGIATVTPVLGKRMVPTFGTSDTRGSPYLWWLVFRVCRGVVVLPLHPRTARVGYHALGYHSARVHFLASTPTTCLGSHLLGPPFSWSPTCLGYHFLGAPLAIVNPCPEPLGIPPKMGRRCRGSSPFLLALGPVCSGLPRRIWAAEIRGAPRAGWLSGPIAVGIRGASRCWRQRGRGSSFPKAAYTRVKALWADLLGEEVHTLLFRTVRSL